MPHADDPDLGSAAQRRPSRSESASRPEHPTEQLPRGTQGQRPPAAAPADGGSTRRRPAAMPTERLDRGTLPRPPLPDRPSARRSRLPDGTGLDGTDPSFPDPDFPGTDFPVQDAVDRNLRRAARDPGPVPERRRPDPRRRAPLPPNTSRSSQQSDPSFPGRQPEPRGAHLPPYTKPDLAPPTPGMPKKLTVTRIAAMRSRQLTSRGVQLFRRAATADGADRSGLTHLTYAVMANYAVDAALAVALANTLFFAAASAESTGKVLLYLLITVAPFAVIAPFIGPLLDRIQHGRRIALAVTSFGRSLLAIVMAFNFDSWVLYPCALGMMVLSKSFGVLKAALTPRVLPDRITLVKTNSRLTVFGLAAGGVAGGVAAAFAGVTNASGALIWTAICGIAGGLLCLRIPAWVESTEGEVPVQHSEVLTRGRVRRFPPKVSATLWANLANRIETGFLALFVAFVVKTEYAHLSGFHQLLVLGIVGAAAGVGGFVGNALGSQLSLTKPDVVAFWSVVSVAVTTAVAIMIPGLAMAAVVGLVGSTSSSLAKVCLDSAVQDQLPEASRASAFGMSESLLQLAWVSGGVVGLLLGGVLHVSGDGVYMIGFGVVTVLVGLGITQSWLSRSGGALVPALAAAWDRRANRRFTKRTGAPATDALTSDAGRAYPAPDASGRDRGARRRPRRAGRSR